MINQDFDEEKFDRELKKRNLIKKVIKGTLATVTIVGLALGGYYVGCYDSTPSRIYKTKVKVGYYQYEMDGYVIENRKGDKFTFQERELEEEENLKFRRNNNEI